MLIGCRPPSGHFSCTLGRLGSGIWVYGFTGFKETCLTVKRSVASAAVLWLFSSLPRGLKPIPALNRYSRNHY